MSRGKRRGVWSFRGVTDLQTLSRCEKFLVSLERWTLPCPEGCLFPHSSPFRRLLGHFLGLGNGLTLVLLFVLPIRGPDSAGLVRRKKDLFLNDDGLPDSVDGVGVVCGRAFCFLF